ncbi:MAG: TatD family nuclease-associated radical SAM protein [Candidatus Margulisbacteria bacterium]|nr:TatD family nuclease-associated radical SAM protein [Candidatus Margulisiibacteriota bacterium]
MDAIAYPIGDSLYLNITNRCTNECPFCIRNKSRKFNQKYDLWLEKEPTAEEVISAIGDPTKYKQIVFCGYGEPTIRLDVIKAVASALRVAHYTLPIRLDTNGHGNLFWGRNILPELKNLIDFISISLNAQNAEVYDRLCHSQYGAKAYPAVIEFIKAAKQYLPTVEATVVDLPIVDKEACQKIAKDLGVNFRIRPYYEVEYVR